MQDGIRIFRGIPYAAAPVGELRWSSPQPAQPWQRVKDATKFGADCPMPASAMPGKKASGCRLHGPNYDIWFDTMAPSGSEDCLSLNVWSPEQVAQNAAVLCFFAHIQRLGAVFDDSAFARNASSSSVRTFACSRRVYSHIPLTRAAAVQSCIGSLPLPVRLCVVLAYQEGMSHQEIAQVSGIPLGTVKSHITRGSTRLREILSDYGIKS